MIEFQVLNGNQAKSLLSIVSNRFQLKWCKNNQILLVPSEIKNFLLFSFEVQMMASHFQSLIVKHVNIEILDL